MNTLFRLPLSHAQLAWLTSKFRKGTWSAVIRAAIRSAYPDFPDDLPARGAAMDSERAKAVRRGERKTTE